MKDYIIKFCWTLEVPVDIKVNGEVVELDKHELYVEAEDTREKIDIIKLNAEIEEIVMRENELREAIRNIIEEIEVGV